MSEQLIAKLRVAPAIELHPRTPAAFVRRPGGKLPEREQGVVPPEPVADVCLLLEGTWPYVRGGVSSWVNQLILGLPELTFSVFFIGGQRAAYGKRHYAIPDNVVHIEEHFLESGWTATTREPRKAGRDVAQAMRDVHHFLHHPDEPGVEEGERVLEILARGCIGREAFLHSRASWAAITDGYAQHCSDPSFINYFWTMRSMQAPIFMLTEAARRMPRARMLHSISTGYAGLLGSVLQRLWGCSLLLSEHGIYTKERKIDLAQAGWIAENPDEKLSTGLDAEMSYIRRLWIRFFERIGLLTYHSADSIIALYEGNRRRQILDGADAARTRVVPNGIALEAWNGALERRPAGIPPVVGLVGRVVPIKDVKTFIRAMRGVVNSMPEAEGWIVGPEEEDPDYVSECRSLIVSLGLQEKVRFLGFRQMSELLPQLGLMVLTSISEAQPLVILEAWAAGTPVVSSDVGSCRELVEGIGAEDRALGLAGEVVAIADPQATTRAILGLLRDPQRWRAAQAAGQQRLRRFYTEELMLTRYQQLYREAMETA
ncbi:GT4 family glycosyltransferase PelF [Pseudomonas schmalbachii]|uniref:GT4 family glycosyltransferase PelF n=1 Tax=Pseudomonas schmalbachii TaxID=2816993 RepID=A0ABS3TTV2_9PSED|nr:GT4 family glycosyltransferase PelF [Pseudomonas schmalbachii]MBO3276568.1 GT4 family glycosyltransferase PelF [Pseudomonas schmalbachii]